MITYVKNNDIKKFNTYALSLKKKQKERAYSLSAIISYLNNVYNTYCVYYNAIVKLQKDVDELTKENLFTKRDYSSYNKVDVTASFNISVNNVKLVKENTAYKYKSTIDDLKRALLNLNLTVKELTTNIVTGLDVYGEMRRSASRIINDGNESVSQVQAQTAIALGTGQITLEEYTEMKETAAETTKGNADEAIGKATEENPIDDEKAREEAEKAREEAEKAARIAFEQEQTRLDNEAEKAQNAANETNNMYDNYKGLFGEHYNSSNDVSSYTDPLTNQSWTRDESASPTLSSYSYSDGTNSVTLEVEVDTGRVSYNGTVYDNWENAAAAANNDLGKEAFSDDQTSFFEKAEETYNSSKKTAAENKSQAEAKADAAANAAKEHESSGSNDSSSGGI